MWREPEREMAALRRKHERTLARIHQRPTPSDVRWHDLISMLKAAGVDLIELKGARVGLAKDGERMVIHRPHPRATVSRLTVRDVATFLTSSGVEP